MSLIPSAGGIKVFQYSQTTPSSVWAIHHGFGTQPTIDTNIFVGGKLEKAFPASIIHTDVNNLTITWGEPRTGFANVASRIV